MADGAGIDLDQRLRAGPLQVLKGVIEGQRWQVNQKPLPLCR